MGAEALIIDADSVQLYREQGWVIVPDGLTPDEVAEGVAP
jgi:hypothetical protein